jgi:hypothetical protein
MKSDHAKTKAELLEHYARKEPKHFYQFDGWEKSEDPFTGGGLTMGETWELMSGVPGIRVLLPDHTTQTEAVTMLRQILDYIEQYPPRRFAQERQGIYTVDNVVVLPRRERT